MAILLLVIGLLAFAVYIIANRRQRDARIVGKIRSSWGQPKNDRFHFERIERYAELMMKKEGFHQLSQQTMEDIDFYDLFSFLDRTSSSVGQQYLFNRLLHPGADMDSLRLLSSTAGYVGSNAAVRERIQKELGRLAMPGAYFICSLLGETSADKPKWMKFLPLSTLLVLILLVLGFQYPVSFVMLIVPLTLNMGLHYWSREKIHRFSRSFPHLSLLIDVADNVRRIDGRFECEKVHESVAQLKPFQWKLGMLASSGNAGGFKDELSQLADYAKDLIKGFLLIEVYMSFNIISELKRKRSAIAVLFNYIGEIDTAISIASVRAGGKTCIPDFVDAGKQLAAQGLYHPLVTKCVSNDLTVNRRSVLITGSNMSGKSTFLRTLIVNSILAQTICTCFADVFRTPVLKQFSSIRLDDSIEKGTSYFFEEVSLMRTLIREAESGAQNVFILDEVFKGTNTLERVAAAKAILSYLNKGDNIVVVSTHDLELSTMLVGEYDLYHFEESFVNGRLYFDHKLKKGPMKNGNAIKILSLSNYPDEIIREATALVDAAVK